MVIIFSGCVEDEASAAEVDNKVSAAEEFDTSFLLINNAESRIMSIKEDIESGTYTAAKKNLKASRADFENAQRILNDISSDYEEENKDIQNYKILAEGGLDRVRSLEYLLIAMEHFDKSLAYMYSGEFNLGKKELDMVNGALNESSTSLISAKEKIFRIDLDSVPVEQKNSFILLRADLETSGNMCEEFREMMSGMYLYMDGSEYLFNGMNYADTEKWGKAADEFGNAADKFSESQKILEKLKDSECSEVSVEATEMYGFLTMVQKDLPHLEAGCRYMENGRYSRAEKEFDMISSF
ncbi:hypothetical protein MSSIT_3189 [Methanosarcina siciliae T4/M]|uniref:Uncharacterized protein n=2 Tax=Methanosarcina siciliae TaxID=38027 RepID=A0A0E3PH98_9EURY|nr:hypothetical protein MSSIT_3189 [Methanosarcina siciliae T4/M]AKB33810.1 hypothetical protein MSSIH_3120 [Methanosarcina siciliae HI350]